MEQRAGADGVALFDKFAAAVGEGVVELLDSVEEGVGERFVDQWPEMFGRLQFRAVGRLVDEADSVGNPQVRRSVPARVVELQDDPLVGAGADVGGEVGQRELEQVLAYGVRDVPHRRARGWLDEAGDVKPFEAVVAKRDGPLADGRPDAARDRLQADAVFVRGPDLDDGAGTTGAFLRDGLVEFFLSSARSASPAALGWRGRGRWIE